MELAEQLDPEEWSSIMQRFFRILAEGVERFEGFVEHGRTEYVSPGPSRTEGCMQLAHETPS